MSYIETIRNRVGHAKIILPFASVILHDEAGRVLLQRRTDFQVWGLPGGVLEPGENMLDCAYRELREETGLEAGPLRLVGEYSHPQWDTLYPNGDQVQQFTLCFEGQVSGGEMRPDGMETNDQRFFAPEEIPYPSLPAYYTAMLEDALRGGPPAFTPPFSRPETSSQIETMRRFLGHNLFIGMGAVAVTVRADGRLLMGLREDDGTWDFPGGFLDLGENAAGAAVREAREETGVEVEIERLLGTFSSRQTWTYPNGDQVQSVVALYKARPVGGTEHADGSETRRLAWFTPQEALRLEYPDMFASVVKGVVECLDDGYFVINE